MFATDQW